MLIVLLLFQCASAFFGDFWGKRVNPCVPSHCASLNHNSGFCDDSFVPCVISSESFVEWPAKCTFTVTGSTTTLDKPREAITLSSASQVLETPFVYSVACENDDEEVVYSLCTPAGTRFTSHGNGYSHTSQDCSHGEGFTQKPLCLPVGTNVCRSVTMAECGSKFQLKSNGGVAFRYENVCSWCGNCLDPWPWESPKSLDIQSSKSVYRDLPELQDVTAFVTKSPSCFVNSGECCFIKDRDRIVSTIYSCGGKAEVHDCLEGEEFCYVSCDSSLKLNLSTRTAFASGNICSVFDGYVESCQTCNDDGCLTYSNIISTFFFATMVSVFVLLVVARFWWWDSNKTTEPAVQQLQAIMYGNVEQEADQHRARIRRARIRRNEFIPRHHFCVLPNGAIQEVQGNGILPSPFEVFDAEPSSPSSSIETPIHLLTFPPSSVSE